jgi:NADH:ubiquinone oxidoreductase subunit 6 (subunit J)
MMARGKARPAGVRVSPKIASTLNPPTEIGTDGVSRQIAAPKLPDVHIIGQTLFTGYNLPLQILGVLLLVATVGVVVLSKRQTN